MSTEGARGADAAAAVLTTASIAVLVSCFAQAAWSSWLFAGAIAVFPVALIALGALRAGRFGRLVAVLTTLFVLLGGALGGLLWLRGRAADATWLGLPAGAALLVYGLFALPLLVTVLGHAWTSRS